MAKGWHLDKFRHRLAALGVKTKRKEEDKQETVARLKKLKVSNVVMKDGWISLNFDGAFIQNKVNIKKHEPYVGVWHKFRNDIYIDKDLRTKRDLEAVAIHESVEKHITQKYGLDADNEAHPIANIVEKDFLERQGGKWDAHQEKVKEVWEEEGSQ